MKTATRRTVGGFVSVPLPRLSLRDLGLTLGAAVSTGERTPARWAVCSEAAPADLVADVLVRVATLIE